METPDPKTPPDANRLGNALDRLVDEVEQVRARVEERNTRRIRQQSVTNPERATAETMREMAAARPSVSPPMPPPDRPSAPPRRLPDDSGRYVFVSATPPRSRRA